MDQLNSVVRGVVFGYAGGGTNLRIYPVENESLGVYAVNMVEFPVRKRPAAVVISARVQGNYVIIEEDITDKPLIDALLEAGIPRDHIISAYAGETVPSAEDA